MGGFTSIAEGLPSANSTAASGVPLGNADFSASSSASFDSFAMPEPVSSGNWANDAFAPAQAMTQQMPEPNDVQVKIVEPESIGWKPATLQETPPRNRLAENAFAPATQTPENKVDWLSQPLPPKRAEPPRANWLEGPPPHQGLFDYMREAYGRDVTNYLEGLKRQEGAQNSIETMAKDASVPERFRQDQAGQRQAMDADVKDGWNRSNRRIEGDQQRPEQVLSPQPAQAEAQKTKNVFDPAVGDKTTPPAYKKGYLSKQPGAWEGFNKATDKLPDAGENQKFAYGQIFAAEGGIAKDPTSSASSGILQGTLDSARKRVPGLDNAKTPSDLTLDQRAAVMKDYFDQSLRTVGGSKALDNLPSPEAAAAFGDAIYRHGSGDGAKVIQEAIRRVDPGRVEADGKMGPDTFKAFQELARNPKTRGGLLDALGKERNKITQGSEYDRMKYFKFRSRH